MSTNVDVVSVIDEVDLLATICLDFDDGAGGGFVSNLLCLDHFYLLHLSLDSTLLFAIKKSKLFTNSSGYGRIVFWST